MRLKTAIVAPMHRIAEDYAQRAKLARSDYQTVTQPQSLRGLSPDVPIIVVDTTLAFTDSRGIRLALTRFTNVRHVRT